MNRNLTGQRVANGYATNRELMDALRQIPKRKQDIVEAPIDILANYRRDLSGKASWKIGGSRYFVVTITKEGPWAQGAVFEAKDGMRFVLLPAATLPQSVGLAAAAGPGTTIFAIRPYWGMPAKDWIAADPEFWKANPMARSK